MENLTRVKHTSVSLSIEDNCEKISKLYKDDYKSQVIVVSSKRLDAIIAKTYKMSRNISMNLLMTLKLIGRILMG